jgi:hypothetical protein
MLALTDTGCIVEMNNTTVNTLAIPARAFAAVIEFVQSGLN